MWLRSQEAEEQLAREDVDFLPLRLDQKLFLFLPTPSTASKLGKAVVVVFMSPSSPPVDARLFNFNHPTSSANGSAASTQASRADALSVYSDAVQTPDVECGNLDSLYCDAQADDTDRPEARVLREDFCSSGE